MSNAANWFNQNVGKEYEVDLTLGAYRELLRAVFCETYRKLTNGGRLCINVANVGRKPYIPLHSIRSAVAVPPVLWHNNSIDSMSDTTPNQDISNYMRRD